jgi:hypothetical protein
VERNYTVFVHTAGEDGQTGSQHGGQPEGGFYPTSYRKLGQVVKDQRVRSLPPDIDAGDYELRVGIYLLEGMHWWSELGGAADGDWVTLTMISVGDVRS